MSTEFTFVVEKTCPVCGQSTRVVKVKSRLTASEVDTDYCCHYQGFNPYLYHIWVCEHCGFAADEKVFLTALPQARREMLANALAEKRVHFDFHETRDIPDGIASIKLAIFCAELLKAPVARLAGLTLRLAWVHRLNDDRKLERGFLEQALELYIRSLEREHYPIESLSDSMVMYLIGALYARLGNNKKAVVYLSRLVDDKNANVSDVKLAKDARKLWQDLRKTQQAMETPADLLAAAEGRPTARSAMKPAAKPAEKPKVQPKESPPPKGQGAKEKPTISIRSKNAFGKWFS